MREHVMHIESDENAVYMLSSDENVLNIHLEQSVSANCAICHPKSAIHAIWQRAETLTSFSFKSTSKSHFIYDEIRLEH